MRFLTAILILFVAMRSFGAAWYLDSAATGAGNGTNWANAWVSPSNVVWGASGVKAGDTLYFSGGTTNKSYNYKLEPTVSGSNGAPITIRVGQDAGHNGVAVIPSLDIGNKPWFVVDGSRSPSFVPEQRTPYLTNNRPNMGLQISRTDSLGIYYEGDGGANQTIKWTEIGPIGTTNDIGTCDGIKFGNLTTMSNILIEYCYIHHCQNDGINQNAIVSNGTTWDQAIVRYTEIQYVGDDGIQATCNGWTIQNCDIRWHYLPLYNGHPDKVQNSGQASKYLKYVNNIMGQSGNSIIIGEHLINNNDFIGPMLIAGNIFANTRESATNWYTIQAYGTTFNAWRANTNYSATNCVWTNLYVFNNTVYWQRNTPFQFGRALPDGDTRSAWDIHMQGALRNNLILDCKYNSPGVYSAFSIHGDGDGDGLVLQTNGVFYTTNSLPVTHNIVAGNNTTMTYHGVQGTNAEVHGMSNKSTMPLIETNNYTFILDATDTVAKDAGYSLDALTNQFPELMFDMNGNPRGAGAGWDIGAMESATGIITNGLVVRINFDTAPTNDDAGYDDSSGYGHHALHMGYMNAHTLSNRCPDQITWTNPVSGEIQTGATFLRYKDGWDEYDASGDYLAITNRTTGKLWTMPVATFSWWGIFSAHLPDDSGYTNWNAGGNRRFASGGYGYKGAWTFGLMSDGDPTAKVRIYTNDTAAADAYLSFGVRINTSTTGKIGYSTNWVLYSMTWSNGLAVTYVNAVPFRTNQFLDGGIGGGALLTNLTIRGPAGLLTGFLEIGGDSHNGNPMLTYTNGAGVLLGDDGDGSFHEATGAKQPPNHGWLGPGNMDDFRIYERVLGTNELDQIYRGTESGGGSSGGGGEEGGGGGSSGGPINATVQTANIGRITGP